jgi:pimeloyl-ACP methyl ester carboxylesterase
LGHSLGGMVATGMSIRHPDLVRNVVTLGTPYRLEGFRPDLVELQRNTAATPSPELSKLLPTEADFAAWRASFERVAPDPKAFDAILARLNAMLAIWPGWTDDELGKIGAPTLIAIGDNDYVQIDHAAEVARLVPNARLAVLPGTTHLGIVRRHPWIEPMMDALTEAEL